MEGIWLLVHNTLWAAFGTVLTALLAWVGAKLVKWLTSEWKWTESTGLASAAWTAAQLGVMEAYQTYVAEIKKRSADGKLTQEERANARKIALDAAKAVLKSQGLGAVDDMIQPMLEAAVARLKGRLGKSPAVVAKPSSPQPMP
jgi:hypothetical protein